MTSQPTPYHVAFSPQAWRKIGQMPHRTFRALQAALDAIAREMDAAPMASDSAGAELHTTAAGVAVTYQREDATRTLTVLEVRPAPPQK